MFSVSKRKNNSQCGKNILMQDLETLFDVSFDSVKNIIFVPNVHRLSKRNLNKHQLVYLLYLKDLKHDLLGFEIIFGGMESRHI